MQKNTPFNKSTDKIAENPLESGAIVSLLTILIALLVGLAIFVMSLAHKNIVRNELQSAADAAALSAANALCGNKKCFNLAPRIAMSVLAKHEVHANLIGDKHIPEIVLTDSEIVNSAPDGISKHEGDFIVRVERGRWLPDRTPRFTSYEDAWQSLTPGRGIPRAMAANSVLVELTRENVGILPLGALGSLAGTTISVRSRAITGPIGPTCVAPFAIPACSLANGYYAFSDEGEPVPTRYCIRDRYFTKTARHNVSGAVSYKRPPSFPYSFMEFRAEYPTFRSHLDVGAQPEDPFPDIGFMVPDYINDEGTYQGWDIAQHVFGDSATSMCTFTNGEQREWEMGMYGVVGLPGTTPDEASIRAMFANRNFCAHANAEASLGNPFFILKEGLRDSLTEDELWRQITNFGLGRELPAHPSLIDVFTNQVMLTEVGIGPQSSSSFCGYPSDFKYDTGICNSRRIGWGGRWGGTPDPTSDCFIGFYDDTTGIPNDFTTPVWKISVPVIAHPDMNPCISAVDGASIYRGAWEEDPDVLGDGWEIIGFLQAIIYDVDVGRPPHQIPDSACFPPSPPYGHTGSFPTTSRAHQTRSFMDLRPGLWGYQDPLMYTSCNAVRARVDCTDAIASAAPTAMRAPALVDDQSN